MQQIKPQILAAKEEVKKQQELIYPQNLVLPEITKELKMKMVDNLPKVNIYIYFSQHLQYL